MRDTDGIKTAVVMETRQMTERYTKRDAYMAFARLASSLGKTWSDDHGKLWQGSAYEPKAVGRDVWERVGSDNVAFVGCWMLDHNSVYGGFVIHEMYNEGGGVSEPFGGMRRTAREFCDAVYFAENALRAAKVTA
jgi:hypothetical protein